MSDWRRRVLGLEDELDEVEVETGVERLPGVLVEVPASTPAGPVSVADLPASDAIERELLRNPGLCAPVGSAEYEEHMNAVRAFPLRAKEDPDA